ncbi:hypothetical protein HYPSUDRAFT_828902 [Hypholoma sublateritium FD-334 SS-4]|uniref:DUF6533 domain-containing protein n=1 Tax=Hypholoma sublateritium (strain FD-334 SS-4) TaxID=945553 RepID=A0A0D2M9W9_HYPSF|nr:hypothetical protein HYPSUDRAFT_828902 [Hypholoma sublateritium FD-334 SS-4]
MVSDDVVIESVRAMQLVTYFDVAASTFFIWDFILTVPLELDLVWRSKWNALKFIYIIQRYLPFFDTVGLVLYHQLSVALTDLECRNLYIASGCLIVVGITFSEMILTLRAWAVWNRGTRLGIILGVLFAVFFLPDFAFLALFLRSLEFDNPSIPQFVGCLVVRVDHILTGCWMIVLVWDALVLALMVVPGFRAYTVGGNSTLLAVIFRDGALYYFVLFLFSTVNIIIIKLFPPQYAQLLTTMERLKLLQFIEKTPQSMNSITSITSITSAILELN